MRLMLSFAAFGPWRQSLRAPSLPMNIALEPYGRYRLEEDQEAARSNPGKDRTASNKETIQIVADRQIERPEDIVVVDDIFLDGKALEKGSEVLAKALTSSEVDELSEGASLVSAALSFAIGVPLSVSPQPFQTNHFIAEDEHDRHLLDGFGLDRVRISHTFSNGVEVFDDRDVDAEMVGELARRGAVRVYVEAMRVDGSAARFRELWRTLEIAFQGHGKRLTALIAEFPPAQELGFERRELESLLVLRGQISHASSRLGPRDVSQFERDASTHLGRLWTLVDRVILTKKDSSRGLEVDELRPLIAHIGPDGYARLPSEIDDPELWFSVFGTRSERFH
jgi:hypothetical protein